MRCIFCRNQSTDVIETRVHEDGGAIRRRRECASCRKRFTTYERVEDIPILVIKRDGRRERFNAEKLRNGIIKAVGKTTVTAKQVDAIVSEVYMELLGEAKQEIASTAIGDMVALRLKKLDKVAYIRFASVFRRFVDVEEFEKELKKLL